MTKSIQLQSDGLIKVLFLCLLISAPLVLSHTLPSKDVETDVITAEVKKDEPKVIEVEPKEEKQEEIDSKGDHDKEVEPVKTESDESNTAVSETEKSPKEVTEKEDVKEESEKDGEAKKETETKKDKGKSEVDHAELLKSARAKSNKVGMMLSLIHKASENATFKKTEDDLENHETFEDKSVEEMLTYLCPRSLGLCTKWVKNKTEQQSDLLLKIAEKIRNRPKGVNPRRLFKHLMFESGAGTLVEQGHDRHLDGLVNIIATKSPALVTPVLLTDLYLKTKYEPDM